MTWFELELAAWRAAFVARDAAKKKFVVVLENDGRRAEAQYFYASEKLVPYDQRK